MTKKCVSGFYRRLVCWDRHALPEVISRGLSDYRENSLHYLQKEWREACSMTLEPLYSLPEYKRVMKVERYINEEASSECWMCVVNLHMGCPPQLVTGHQENHLARFKMCKCAFWSRDNREPCLIHAWVS